MSRTTRFCGSSSSARVAILPDFLEHELEPAVAATLEPVLRKGRTGDVAAQPLELPAIAAVDRLSSVEIDPADLGDRIAVILGRRVVGRLGADEQSQRRLSWSLVADRDARSGRGVTGSESCQRPLPGCGRSGTDARAVAGAERARR
jgi:hypothetical protein